MKNLIILCVIGFSFSAFAVTPVTPTTNSKDVTCKSGSDERKLVIADKDGGCELQYTKGSETSVKATQKVGDEKCVEISNLIKEKLVAANFDCQ